MHSFSSKRGAARAVSLVSRRAVWAGLGLAAASLAVAVGGQATRAKSPQAPQPTAGAPAFGEPVNIYVANKAYAPPAEDGEIHPEHIRGQVWILTGEPGGSNVVVQVGDQGVIVVDTGTTAMAPKLLAAIQRLAQEH